MSSRRNRFIVIATLLMGLLPGAVQAMTLKIASIAPDGTNWMKVMRASAAEVSKRTQDRVKFKFYPGGVMGSDKSVMRKIRVGQLHGGVVTAGAVASAYPDSQIYSLPFLFHDYDEMSYVRQRVDREILKGLEQAGFVSFGLSDGGFSYLMSDTPVRSIADLRAKKVWIPEGDEISRSVFNEMGIKPIQLPTSDVYTGLQTGMINTVGTSPIGAVAFQWYTKAKYLNDSPLLYLIGLMVVQKKAFSRIATQDQAVVREVFGRAYRDLNHQNHMDNLAAKKALKQNGIKFIDFDPAELSKMQKYADTAIDGLKGKGYYSTVMLQLIERHRGEYRKNHKRAAR